MVGAIIAAVLFWFLKELIAVVIFGVCVGLAALLSGGNDGIIVAGGILGWILAAVWTVFAIVQTIVQVVSIVQLAAG